MILLRTAFLTKFRPEKLTQMCTRFHFLCFILLYFIFCISNFSGRNFVREADGSRIVNVNSQMNNLTLAQQLWRRNPTRLNLADLTPRFSWFPLPFFAFEFHTQWKTVLTPLGNQREANGGIPLRVLIGRKLSDLETMPWQSEKANWISVRHMN